MEMNNLPSGDNRSTKIGFTLIELLVVIAIIGILSTLAIVALGSARQKSRDAKRVADAQQISKALELYYGDANGYPSVITAGQPISYGSTTYLQIVPSNPSPRVDGNCPNNDYAYAGSDDPSVGYTMQTCLGAATGALPAGNNYIGPGGFNSDPSLIGWWRLDDSGTSIVDSSISAWNATATSIVPQGSSSCKFAGCSLFGTSGSYIKTNSQVTIASPTNSLSISAWIYLTDNSSNPHTIMGDGTTGTSSGFIWFYVPTGGTSIRFHYANGINNADGSLSGCIALNSWRHVAVTADYTNKTIKYYCNGVLNTTSTMAGTPLFPSATRYKYIGSYSGGTFDFTGSLDDMRLYNRVLNANEVQALYRAGQ